MSNQPPIEVPQGAIRLNTDSQKLEFFAQDRWYEMATDSPTLDGGARGFWLAGSFHPSVNPTNVIEFVTISTLGNSQDFGDLVNGGTTYQTSSSSNSTKMLATNDHSIEQIIIATLGNGTDFGDLSIVPSRHIRSRDAYVVDPEYITIGYLQTLKQRDLARTGHSERKLMSCEFGLYVMSEANGIIADLS